MKILKKCLAASLALIITLSALSQEDVTNFLNASLIENFKHALQLDKYYYTPEDSELEFILNQGATADSGKLEKLNISIVQDCHLNSRTLLSLDCNSVSGNLPLKGLPLGTLYLRASWEQSGKPYQTIRAFQLNPRPLQPPSLPPNGKLTARGKQLYLNEDPIFLISASPTDKHFLQNQGSFNLAYGKYGSQENAICFEEVQGPLLLRLTGWIGYTFPPWEKLQNMFREQFQPATATQNCLCRIAYEAQMGVAIHNPNGILDFPNGPQWYQKIYQELKQISPETLFSIQVDNFAVAGDYVPSCDILEVASWPSSYGSDMMPHLQRDMTEIKENCPDKPILFWLGGTIPNKHCRIAEELRGAAFLAVANDLAGIIIHMGHGYLPAERSRLWSMVSNLNAEIQPVFELFHQSGQPKDISFIKTQGIHLSARQKGSLITVIAVNQSGSLNTLYFPKNATVMLPFENKRSLNLREDVLSAYEAKVYQLHFKP